MEETTTTKRMGRPPGRRYRAARTLLLTPADEATVRALAEKWDCSVAEAFRRSMNQAAKREKVA